MEEPMNEQPNEPITTGSANAAGIAGWFSTWMTAVTKPNEQTYEMLAARPEAMSNNTAFTWVFVAGTASALISGYYRPSWNWPGFLLHRLVLASYLAEAQRKEALSRLG
jgi:hypothetical protein